MQGAEVCILSIASQTKFVPDHKKIRVKKDQISITMKYD